MRYICLGYLDEERWDAMSETERNAFLDDCAAHSQMLKSRGNLLAAEALEGARSAATLRLQNGRISITDGPFAETKEQLGGFMLLEARDLNHAIQLVSNHPGLRLGAFEVRPIDEHNSCQNREIR